MTASCHAGANFGANPLHSLLGTPVGKGSPQFLGFELNQSFSRGGSRNGVGSHYDRHRNTINPEGLDDLKMMLDSEVSHRAKK